jgi:hypothetical protein
MCPAYVLHTSYTLFLYFLIKGQKKKVGSAKFKKAHPLSTKEITVVDHEDAC